MTIPRIEPYLRQLDAHSHGRARFYRLRRGSKEFFDALVPIDTAAALDWHSRGYGSLALACGYGDLAILDVDDGLDQLDAARGRLAGAPMIWRANARNRGKFLIYCEGLANERREVPGRRIEVLVRAGAVAGLHPSGSPYNWTWDGLRIPVMEPAEVRDILDTFAPRPQPQPEPILPSVQPAPRPDNSIVQAAIHEFCRDAVNELAVRDALARRPHSKKAAALRDERTPSLIESRTRAKDGRVTWFDYGSGEVLDVFEMAVRLGLLNFDKRLAVREVVAAYRARKS